MDAAVYTRLRRRSRLGAIAVSNAAGFVVDSLLFVPLAFDTVAAVPLLVSHRHLAGRRTLPRASGRWALDSGGCRSQMCGAFVPP